jgi:PAS domain S-box-containing protein
MPGMSWFGNRLNRKFTLATIVGFVMSSAVFLLLFLAFYQGELERERAQAAREVNRLLQSSLENAMLKRDLDGLLFIVERLGQQPNIRTVFIANPQGEVRFSSNPDKVGKRLLPALDVTAGAEARFLRDESGNEVLRSVNPVHNKPQCQVCHGPVEQKPVNGILVVDYDATSIRESARHTTLMLMGAGALIVIINLVGGWWFIRRFILKPVALLNRASEAIAAGDLETRVELPGDDELARLGHTFNGMAENLQSHLRELQEGKVFLQALVDAIPDGVRIIDRDYRMILVNRAFREQTGCPDQEWLSQPCYRAAHGLKEPCPDELITCPLETVQKDGCSLKLIHHHRTCRGEPLDVEIFAAPMRVTLKGKEQTFLVESIRDLTRQVRFTHEQRLSELGRLAAGVAHEIYNPLSSMKLALASLPTMLVDCKGKPELEQLLQVVEGEMEQCINITDRLLRLSAAPMDQPELVHLDQIIHDILSLLKWEAERDGVELKVQFEETPLRLLASQSDMRMLVLNLVQNAFHAMPEGGRLLVTGGIDGDQVVVRFRDSGVGIAPEELSHIFTPFFSRRADGVRGTGLGLAIAKAILEGVGGHIEVESRLGEGSCFTVRMPRAGAEGENR